MRWARALLLSDAAPEGGAPLIACAAALDTLPAAPTNEDDGAFSPALRDRWAEESRRLAPPPRRLTGAPRPAFRPRITGCLDRGAPWPIGNLHVAICGGHGDRIFVLAISPLIIAEVIGEEPFAADIIRQTWRVTPARGGVLLGLRALYERGLHCWDADMILSDKVFPMPRFPRRTWADPPAAPTWPGVRPPIPSVGPMVCRASTRWPRRRAKAAHQHESALRSNWNSAGAAHRSSR
jgi:hypothetical protein